MDSKIKLAMMVVKALRADFDFPRPTDPMVKRWAAKPTKELKEKYAWAVQANSAMTWNTMLAGGPIVRRKRN